VDQPRQKRPGGQHDGVGREAQPQLGYNAGDALTFECKIINRLLKYQ